MNRFITTWAWLGVLAVAFAGGVATSQARADGEEPGERRAQHDDDTRNDDARADRSSRRGGPGSRDMDEAMLRHLLDDLDLTDEQKASIRDALHKAREQRRAWWQEHGEAMRHLRHAIHEARQAGDREQFRQHWARLGELMFDAPESGAVIEDVQSILTDEQREKLDENWKAARERMRERRRDDDDQRRRSRDDDDHNDNE
ncbi:MAG: Spy/CpxP family protein refolding chaperone [Phycisphaeraceae bacterium]